MKTKSVIKINRVAKIKTSDLPIPQRVGQPPVHYLLVREYNPNTKKYAVNICTHLDRKNRLTGRVEYNQSQLRQVKRGNVYPIPRKRATFPDWTGIKKKVHYVKKGKLYDFDCFKINKYHKESYTKFYK